MSSTLIFLFLQAYLSPCKRMIIWLNMRACMMNRRFKLAKKCLKYLSHLLQLTKNQYMHSNNYSRYCIVFFIFFFLVSFEIYGQPAGEKKLSVFFKNQIGFFPLVTVGSASPITLGRQEETVVKIAANALKEDIRLVTGKVPSLDSSGILRPYIIIIGTIGESKILLSMTCKRINSAWPHRYTITPLNYIIS